MSDLVVQIPAFLQQNAPLFEAAGGFFIGAYSDAMKDLAGIAGGNQLKVWKMQKMAQLLEDANLDLNGKTIKPETVSPSIGVPLLEAAALEERPDIYAIWVKLLAAAMDPARANAVRASFISIVQKLDPLDALILNNFNNLDRPGALTNTRRIMANKIARSETDIEVSFFNLIGLDLAFFGDRGTFQRNISEITLSPKGIEFLRILNP